MAKIVQDRAVYLRDGGKTQIFLPGDEIPDHLDDQVQNAAALYPDDYEEPEDVEETGLAPEDSNTPADSDASQENDGAPEPTEDDESEEDEDAEETTGSETHEELDEKYTVPQLRQLAEDEGADLTGLSKKDELIEAILENREARANNG